MRWITLIQEKACEGKFCWLPVNSNRASPVVWKSKHTWKQTCFEAQKPDKTQTVPISEINISLSCLQLKVCGSVVCTGETPEACLFTSPRFGLLFHERVLFGPLKSSQDPSAYLSVPAWAARWRCDPSCVFLGQRHD